MSPHRPKFLAKSGPLGAVGATAGSKIIVMGLSGLLGIFTGRLIIAHFGTAAYAQYGLLSSLPSLVPFADLGIATVVINAVAGSDTPRTDTYVRRSIVTALRILLISGSIFILVGVIITVFGWWPILLGGGLLPNGGSLAAFLCMAVFGLALPLVVGQRILVGLKKTTTQVAAQAVLAPFIFLCVGTVALFAIPAGPYLAVFTFLASALVSVICLIIAARSISPQIGQAIREVPFRRKYPGVYAIGLAWPMLVQIFALPVAMQTDRLLLSHLTHGNQLAEYNLASQLYGIVIQTIFASGVVLWPIYARARAKSTIESPMRPTLYFIAGGLAMGGALAAVSPWIVEFISGGKITLDFWLVFGFVAFVALEAAKYPVGMYMTDKRGLQFQVIPILILVPVNLALSWWLIGIVGAGGPIIGSAISVAAFQVLPNFWYVRRDLARRRAAAQAEASGEPGEVAAEEEATPAEVAMEELEASSPTGLDTP